MKSTENADTIHEKRRLIWQLAFRVPPDQLPEAIRALRRLVGDKVEQDFNVRVGEDLEPFKDSQSNTTTLWR